MESESIVFAWGHYLHFLEELLADYGIDPHPGVSLLFVAIFLIAVSFFAGKKYRTKELVPPAAKIGFSNLVVIGIESLYEIVHTNIGDSAKKLFWLLGGFFVFILTCNMIGLVPGFTPPTDKFSITFTLGCISFLLYNYIGIKAHKFRYVHHFLGPVIYLAPLIGAIELVSHLARPLTLGLRLFGNIVGDHFVVTIFNERIFPLILPIPFIVLGLFISLVQAFVFFQLSLVYVSGAAEEAH
ncbi:MAG: F0F1 ATP synthase subunit A [SAR324 cluster bacterium]|nr:F0F1 ATP synthase subunit A [SAR324 cluster bacterium]